MSSAARGRLGWLICALIGHKPYMGALYRTDPTCPITVTARYCLRCGHACEVTGVQ